MSQLGPLDKHLLGPLAEPKKKGQRSHSTKASRYLALHLRFEIDMVAHSLCEFGGGKEEQKELEAYREKHFPALIELKKTQKYAILNSSYISGLSKSVIRLCLIHDVSWYSHLFNSSSA